MASQSQLEQIPERRTRIHDSMLRRMRGRRRKRSRHGFRRGAPGARAPPLEEGKLIIVQLPV